MPCSVTNTVKWLNTFLQCKQEYIFYGSDSEVASNLSIVPKFILTNYLIHCVDKDHIVDINITLYTKRFGKAIDINEDETIALL